MPFGSTRRKNFQFIFNLYGHPTTFSLLAHPCLPWAFRKPSLIWLNMPRHKSSNGFHKTMIKRRIVRSSVRTLLQIGVPRRNPTSWIAWNERPAISVSADLRICWDRIEKVRLAGAPAVGARLTAGWRRTPAGLQVARRPLSKSPDRPAQCA